MNAETAYRIACAVNEKRAIAESDMRVHLLMNAYADCQEKIADASRHGITHTFCDVMPQDRVEALKNDGYRVEYKAAFDGVDDLEATDAGYAVEWKPLQSQ